MKPGITFEYFFGWEVPEMDPDGPGQAAALRVGQNSLREQLKPTPDVKSNFHYSRSTFTK